MRISTKAAFAGALALATASTAVLATADGFKRMTYRDYRYQLRDAHLAYEKKDFEKAFALYTANACAGEKSSQFALASMYLNGEGTQADGMKAYGWLTSAAEAREPEYRKMQAALEKALPAEHRAAAEAYAKDLIARYGAKATNVSCQMRATLGTNIERLECAPPVDARTGYVEIKLCE